MIDNGRNEVEYIPIGLAVDHYEYNICITLSYCFRYTNIDVVIAVRMLQNALIVTPIRWHVINLKEKLSFLDK